ncbi:MAG: MBL fold metallo-hydrolase [Neisseria sp.]|nr:MBL fold metallo-hydrolase [Neisseria sp.]
MNIHRLQGYIQQIYLVEYPDKLLLLDGGCRCDVKVVRDFIEQELSRSIKDLKTVVVTHMHPDHAGGAHALRRISGCRIVAADRRKQWYGGVFGLFRFLTDIALGHWMAGRLHKEKTNIWYCPYLRPDVRIAHGETVPDFPEWQVFETIGHTDRDLSVYHADSGTIYTADLILRLKNRLTPPLGVAQPNDYKASLRFVQSLRAKTFLLAHGGTTELNDEDFEQMIAATPSKINSWHRYVSTMMKKQR